MQKLWAGTLSGLLLLVSLLNINTSINSSLFASVPRYAQEETAIWETYTTKGEEFSVLMPELPGVSENEQCYDIGCYAKRVEKTYAAYSNGVVYLVTSYENEHHHQSLDEIIAERISKDEMSSSDTIKIDVKLDKFNGKRFITKSKFRGNDVLSTFYLADNHVYEVRAVGGSRNDPAIQEFFKSFALGSKKGKEIGDGARTGVSSVTASVSPKVDSQSSNDKQPVISGGGTETVLKPKDVTLKAVIVTKPAPDYTVDAQHNQVTGTVTLQMIFASSGKVIGIRTISGLPFGLTEKAIAAARKIYFLPAVKDGKRVSQYIRVEYNFSIY